MLGMDGPFVHLIEELQFKFKKFKFEKMEGNSFLNKQLTSYIHGPIHIQNIKNTIQEGKSANYTKIQF